MEAVSMKTREEILAGLCVARRELQETFPVRALARFGSCARNQQTGGSDVDVLVEVDPSLGLGSAQSDALLTLSPNHRQS